MKKLAEIWNNSLVLIGVLGVMVILLSYFVEYNENLLMFSQLLAITVMGGLAFYTYMLFLRGCGKTKSVLLLMLGSGGTLLGLTTQILTGQVYDKPHVLNISLALLGVGIVAQLNKYINYNGDSTRSKV